MIIDGESEVLSDVEVILPREVMETCRDLQQGGTSCFLSVNKQACTTSQLVIHKLDDDSIKIRITVMSLGSNVDDTKQASKVSDTQHEVGDVAVGEEDGVDVSHQPGDPSSYKRRSFKGKPRIPTAVDTSRLNKHLTNIWSSKRKKPFKKSSMPPGDTSPTDMIRESDIDVPDVGAAGDATDDLFSQASTVIIVKTLQQKQEEAHSPAKVMRLSEDMDNKSEVPFQKGSRDIAERLKAKKQRFSAASGGSNVDGSVNHGGQVACELCAETVSDYVQLVKHVSAQHEDCTYVRNYLDEIQPIADALTAVRLECDACGRTFAGQTALAAHRHECSTGVSKTERVSKLGAQRKRVTAKLLSRSQNTGDQSRQNEATTLTSKSGKKSAKSATTKPAGDRDHCKRTFSSEDKLSGHVARMHNQTDVKQRAGVGRSRGKPSPTTASSKSATATPATGKKSQQPSNSTQTPASSGNEFQRCDHCTACFSRTSLLVTHMRYCLKAGDSNR